MADNTQPSQEDIRILLSSYLDGEVTDRERAIVEQAIAASPDLREELELLRQTVEMVSALPPVPAPRPFTLSEADVGLIRPSPKRRSWLPAWAGGLAMAAAAMICVLIAGGLYFGAQFSGGEQAPAAEIARFEQSTDSAASQAAEAPAEAALEMAAEEEESAEEAMIEEEAAEPAETQAEAPVMEVTVETEAEAGVTDTTTEEKAIVPEKEEQDLAGESAADEAAPLDDQAETANAAGETERDGDQMIGGIGGGGTLPTGTPPPMPTPSPLPTPTVAGTPLAAQAPAAQQPAPAEEAPLAQEAAPAEESAEEEELAEEEGEAMKAEDASISPADETQMQAPTFGQEAARRVEIQQVQLQVQPGSIQLEGVLEVEAGTVLSATLQRNQTPFNEWANPDTLQSVVQPNGRFVLIIRANSNRTDVDLFSQEQATYQITLAAIDLDSPVVATVQFDTRRQATALPAPTFTPAPALTVPPPAPPPTIQPTITLAPAPQQPDTTARPVVGWMVIGATLLTLVVVVITGVIIWSVVRKR